VTCASSESKLFVVDLIKLRVRIYFRGLDKTTELYFQFPLTPYPRFVDTSTHCTPLCLKVIAVSLRSLTIAISKRENIMSLPKRCEDSEYDWFSLSMYVQVFVLN